MCQPSYDEAFERRVQAAEVVSLSQAKSGRLPVAGEYRLLYHTKDVFKKTTKAVGLMDDFKVQYCMNSVRRLLHHYFMVMIVRCSSHTVVL